MSRTLQFKRYANTAVANTTGANGELIIDTTNWRLTIHDGVTKGGYVVSSATSNVNRLVANSYTATLTTTGNLNIPGNLNIGNNSSLLYLGGAFSYLNLTANTLNDLTGLYLGDGKQAELYANTDVLLTSNGNSRLTLTWKANGQLIFPDGSKQNTAFSTSYISNITNAYNQANAANVLAQTAYTRANGAPNIFVGTNSFATAPLGSLYFSSNTGIDIVGTTGSVLYINSPQNLRTNGTPTFANVTSNNFYTNTGIDLFTFANAAYSQANVASGAAAYNQANTANLIANTAAANITVLFAIDGVQNTNIASAWSQANAANVLAQSSFNQANLANVLAQSSYTFSNTVNVFTQASYTQANAANVLAQSAYTQANSANILAQAAFTAANNAAQTVPQNAQTATYTLQLSDAGKYIYYTQASNTLLYIPTTANVAFSNGTTIMIVSKTTSSANVTVSPNTGVSLYLAGNTTSASRNVTTYGMATLILADKNANTWFINGTGVS
jgi:hypothetical protein